MAVGLTSPRPHHVAVRVSGCVLVWFGASIFLAFANKHLLSEDNFHYPFFLTACSNSGVSLLSFCVTRLPAFRHAAAPLARDKYWHVVMPLSVASTLDIGFSTWSLLYLDVAFHTILKGTAPLFTLVCGLAIKVERPSRRTPVAVILIVIGLCFVGGDRLTLPDRPLGVLLGLLSVSCTGLRWALTQLLMRGRSGSEEGVEGGRSGAEAGVEWDCSGEKQE